MNRRRFISSLAVGVAALAIRFRPQSAAEISPKVVATGEYGEYRWVLMSAFRPLYRQDYVPIVIHRCPPQNYAGTIDWMKP